MMRLLLGRIVLSLMSSLVISKNVRMAFWNTSSCDGEAPDSHSKLVSLDGPADRESGQLTCTHVQAWSNYFDGFAQDLKSDKTIAWINTETIGDGCQLIFYEPSPGSDQYPEEIATSRCFQAYRRVNKYTSCSSVLFNKEDFAVSYCCGKSCRVPQHTADMTEPVFPEAPPLPLPGINRRQHDTRATKPARLARARSNAERDDNDDVSTCVWHNSTPVRTTYLPSVALQNEFECASGQDLGGGPCEYSHGFSGEVQLMSTQSLGISEAIQGGLEFILSETTTFSYDKSFSVTNGQSITNSQTVTLPQGRHGYATFKQLLKCANGTFDGCEAIVNLPDQEWCLPVLAMRSDQGGNPQAEAVGIMLMMDSS